MSSSRMKEYVPLVQRFVSRVFLHHSVVAAKLGLNATDLKALQLIGEEPLSPTRLGIKIGITGAAMTAVIDKLEQLGFVVRDRDGNDRRRVTVRAVPERLRDVETLYAPYHQRMSKLLATYSAQEYRAIADYLARATTLLEEGTSRGEEQP